MLVINTITAVTLLMLLNSVAPVSGMPAGCAEANDVCEYWLTIEERLTMLHNRNLMCTYMGKIYNCQENRENATAVPMEEVLTVDGVHRMVITINGTIPGPPIIVYEGQTIKVHVHNKLLSDSVTIHWHGQHQRGTPVMDGVPYVTHCPIASGQTFTYEFKASPRGTFWYHSHIGAQRSNGFFGALIIKERFKDNEYKDEFMMQVGDWSHKTSEEIFFRALYGNFIGIDPYRLTGTLDGSLFTGVAWVSGLIEGRGRYIDPTTGMHNGAPLMKYTVERSFSYRFRAIGVGTVYPVKISIDNHTLTVISTDGFDVEPVEVQAVIINPGERYDFVVNTNQPVGNYWIRVVSLEVGVTNHRVEAILHYDGAGNAEPTSAEQTCSQSNPCTILNCPYRYYPEAEHRNCVLVAELRALHAEPVPEFTSDSEEHFLNFAFPGEQVLPPGSVNGRKFEFPGVNSLTQPDEIGSYDCDKHDCGVDKVCYCHYQLEVPFNKTIQMVWSNLGFGAGFAHPIHLHGHTFYVLKMEYSHQNRTTGALIPPGHARNNTDIDCGGDGRNYCNAPKWTNSSWNNGNVPGLNFDKPPRKDTLIIPTGSYAVIRIRSDNPGKWFLHCHIGVHPLAGMAMIFNEAPNNVPTPPKGLPICSHFYNDHTRDISYIKESDQIVPITEDENCEEKASFLVPVCVLGSIVLMQALIIFYYWSQSRKE